MNWQAADNTNVKFAAGHMNIENEMGTNTDVESSFIDAQLAYQFSQYTNFVMTGGIANGDLDDKAVMAQVISSAINACRQALIS